MTYFVQSRWGESETDPSESKMRDLLAELDTPDPEHPDTWLTHENGWTLAVHETGLVVWENVDQDLPARHLLNVSRDKALELWQLLAQGALETIEQEAWQPGHSPPVNKETLDKYQQEIAEYSLAQAKEFYDSLGEERPAVPCREPGCKRGAITLSVLCRVHHFEMIRRRPCPFSH
jgi:hypothetical protein